MKRRRLKKILARIYDTPLCILPSKFGEIASLIENEVHGISTGSSRQFEEIGHPPISEVLPLASQGSFSGSARTETAPSKIAVLNLYGTIAQRMNLMMSFSGGTSTQVFGAVFDEVIADPDVSTIVIRVNSPGGEVPGVEELSDKIFKARGEKKIIAHVDPMMASAATWIATAADEIIAAPSALTIGSIGVMSVHYEGTKRHEDAGDTYTMIRSVPGKAEGTQYEELTAEYHKHLQERANAIHEKFVAAVARNRGVSIAKVEKDFGAGRTMMAEPALKSGLIDRIATFEDLLSELGARSTPDESESAGENDDEISTAVSSVVTTALSPGVLENANTPERSLIMDPQIRLALVQAGLIKANAEESEAEAALQLFFDVKGVDVPADAAQCAEAIFPKTKTLVTESSTIAPSAGTPGAVPANINANLGFSDLTALVETAGASLSVDDRAALTRELVTAHEAAAETGGLSTRQVLDTISQRTTANNPPAGATPPVSVTADGSDKFMAAARDEILLARMNDRPEQIFDRRQRTYIEWKPDTRSQGLASPLAIARQCLVHAGADAYRVMNMSEYDVARLAAGGDPADYGMGGMLASDGSYNVSGMFSNIFLDAGNVTLRRGFDDGRSSFQMWMNRGEDIPNFKPVHRVIAGELGDPQAIAEDGEFEETTMSDGKESYKLTTWGRIFSYTWEMIMNDSLGAFMAIPTKMGSAMRRKMNRLAYQTLKDNANLSDGGALFNSNAITVAGGHNNLTTGSLTTAADYVAAFGAMQSKMRKQKGLDEESSTLNLEAQYVICASLLDDIIRTALGSQSVALAAAGNSNTENPWQGRLQPIPEPELDESAGGSDTQFVLAASHTDVDTVEYAYLRGLGAPVLESHNPFNRLGQQQRIYFAFGVKPLDFRGLQQHTGAA